MEIDCLDDGSESSDSGSDNDYDIEEINRQFCVCPHVHSQSTGPSYILHISATKETFPYIATAHSDNVCNILGLSGSQVAKVTHFNEHSDKLIDCKFCPENNTLLYTGSSDGTIKLWDLRDSKTAVITFSDTTLTEKSTVKPISSFDVSSCNRLLAAGTDLTEGEAFILFWDVRHTKLLGAYWESHTDDIIQVKFNPENSNKLASGSTDGLINIYDLSESCEDDALQESLNTENIVENLQWFYDNGQWKISCITSTVDLQLWECDGAEPYKHFRRDHISQQTKIKTEDTYLVKAHQVKNSLLVLAGSNIGRRKVLRSTQILNEHISPAFAFSENAQRVRASWLNENTGLLITGGEKGTLDIWKPDFSVLNFKTSKRK